MIFKEKDRGLKVALQNVDFDLSFEKGNLGGRGDVLQAWSHV